MVYLYYGENTYLLENKLRAFKERYRERFENSLNVYQIDFSEEDPSRLRTIIRTHTMFTATKLVFAQNISALNVEYDAWVRDLLKKSGVVVDKETVIVFYERAAKKQVKKAQKLFTYVEKYGTAREFEPLQGAKLKQWVTHYVKDGGGTITRAAVDELVLRTGEGMVRLANELDKLLLYGAGTIDEAAVSLLVSAAVETDIFKTIDALAERDVAKALSLIQEHEEAGDDPFQLMGMFAYELRILLLIREAQEQGTEKELKKKHGIHPFVVKKNRTRARAFSVGELLSLHTLLSQTDLAVKTGVKEPYEGLQDAILGFAGSAPQRVS